MAKRFEALQSFQKGVCEIESRTESIQDGVVLKMQRPKPNALGPRPALTGLIEYLGITRLPDASKAAFTHHAHAQQSRDRTENQHLFVQTRAELQAASEGRQRALKMLLDPSEEALTHTEVRIDDLNQSIASSKSRLEAIADEM